MTTSTQLYANNAKSTLAVGINTIALSITVATGEGALFPSPSAGQYFLATLEVGSSREIVTVTSRSGDVLTLGARAQEGTTAASWAIGTTIGVRITKGTAERWTRYQDRLYDISSIDLLDTPLLSDGNSYIAHSNNEAGNPIIPIRNTDTEWSFFTHEVPIVNLGSVTSANKCTAIAISAAGTSYTPGDTLTVLGGTSSFPTTITVNSVSGGVVTGVSIATAGLYTVNPGNPVSVTGGTGTGATFNLTLTTANTTTSMASTSIGATLTGFISGKYILQFTSGALIGKPRIITAVNTNYITWATAFGSAPSPGDAFKIYVSNVSSITSPIYSTIGLSSAGTNRVVYTDGSKLLTTSANLTFDGSTLNTFGSNVLVKDSTGFQIKQTSDPTKIAIFDVSPIATGTTRTFSLPNVNDTLVTLTATQNLTNKTLTNGTITGNTSDTATTTKSGTFDARTGNSFFTDTLLSISKTGDTTRILQFSAANISPSTTRILSAPNQSGTIVVQETNGLVSPDFGGMPIASIIASADPAGPTGGYLLCNAQAVSRTTYANLFARVSTTYGAGNGTTTFNVPDCRGRTIFGVDAGTGRISSVLSNALGAVGGDQLLQSHGHGVNDGGHAHGTSDPGHIHGITSVGGIVGTGGGAPVAASTSNSSTDSAVTGISITSAVTGITIQANGSGGSQNIPPAICFNYYIKY
jgi:microcystin-dependent protein